MAASDSKRGIKKCGCCGRKREAERDGNRPGVPVQVCPEMRDRPWQQRRIVRMRPGNQGAEAVTPMRVAEKEKTRVQIPDREGIPAIAVRMSDRARPQGIRCSAN